MNEWKKWIGAAAVVLIVLFIAHNFAPASVKQQLGIS